MYTNKRERVREKEGCTFREERKRDRETERHRE